MSNERHEHQHGPHDRDHDHTHSPGLRGLFASIVRPHSHDAADSLDDALAGSTEGIKAGKLSLIVLGATALLQLVVVVLSGSVALLADTIHNLGDASTAIPLWLAFSLSRRAANRHYTYGYGRAEDLAGVFVLLMIATSSVIAAWESIDKLIHPHPVTHLLALAAAAIIGFLGKEAVAQYRIRAGRRIGSAALVADGYHARTDGLTSLAVLFGAAGVWLGFPTADPLVGLAITVVILFILRDATMQMWRRLMDAVDPKLLDSIEQAARTADGVLAVSSVHVRWTGHTLFAEVLVAADSELTLAEAHAVAERVRHAMFHAAPKLAEVTVHVDPYSSTGNDPHADLDHHGNRRGA